MAQLPLPADTWMEDALRDFPHTAAFLRERGVVCVQCGEPVWGTLAEAIAEKGLGVETLLAELNAFLEEKEG